MDYLTTDTELTSIANAIRTKGGTTAQLTYPTGFINAINSLGGGGLEYEEGTYTPTADTSAPQIDFTNTHTNPPAFVFIGYTGGTPHVANTLNYWAFMDNRYLLGSTISMTTGNAVTYAFISGNYNHSGGNSTTNLATNTNYTSTTPSTYPSVTTYYVTNTYFIPRMNNQSYIFPSGYTYKWIAIWK